MVLPLLVATGLLVATTLAFALVLSVSFQVVGKLAGLGFTQGVYWKSVAVMMTLAILVAASHLVAIAMWAFALVACGQFSDYGTAFYHSATNYTTLGTGDIVMIPEWRILAPLEAVNGVLLLGLSTAVMFAAMSRLFQNRFRREHSRKSASSEVHSHHRTNGE
jgi:hypothetical protein